MPADAIAVHVQTLGGLEVAPGENAASERRVGCAPRNREGVQTGLSRLGDSHELNLKQVCVPAREAFGRGKEGTNDLRVGQLIIRMNFGAGLFFNAWQIRIR